MGARRRQSGRWGDVGTTSYAAAASCPSACNLHHHRQTEEHVVDGDAFFWTEGGKREEKGENGGYVINIT